MRLLKCCSRGSVRSNYSRRTYVSLVAGWLTLLTAVLAAAPPSASARVHSYIVVNAQTGAVLEAHNADVRTYPASLAKLMTLYITFHQLSTGKMTLHERLRVSYHAAAQPPTKLFLRPGERVSVNSLILGITTRSANDAAVVLAEGIGGTETNFVKMMNQTTRQLGMDRTTFRNASGLPNRWQRTTARDMATLALAILHTYPQYYHYFGVNKFDFRGKMIYGYDRLLGRYPGVDGMKTGYTYASGYNIVTSAVRHGRRLLGVVMGGSTAYSRDRLMVRLLNEGFSRVRRSTLASDSQREHRSVHHPASRYASASVRRREAVRTPRPDYGWIVQIGGNFYNSHQVRRVLDSARRTAPKNLRGARPLVVQLRGRRYRARFANMSEVIARRACRVLHDRGFTCTFFHIPSSRLVLASDRR